MVVLGSGTFGSGQFGDPLSTAEPPVDTGAPFIAAAVARYRLRRAATQERRGPVRVYTGIELKGTNDSRPGLSLAAEAAAAGGYVATGDPLLQRQLEATVGVIRL